MDNTRAVVSAAMEAYFGEDAKRINHAHRVTGYAEELLKLEGGDYPIVIVAGLLHDIGIHEAEKKYNSTAGKYQEQEGPPIAREILTGLGFAPGQIDEICQIIGHHHSPGAINTLNFKILYDADWLVNLKDEFPTDNKDRLAGAVEKLFLTPGGKTLARRLYLET
jgi:HD superfamily phosphodiesterase